MTENKNKTRKRKRKTPYNSISYTTGDIGLNIDRFNQAFGTADGNEIGIGGASTLSEATAEVANDIDSLVENWWKGLF